MRLEVTVQLISNDSRLYPNPTFFFVEFKDLGEMLGDIDDYAVSHALSGEGSTCSPGNQRRAVLGSKVNEFLDIRLGLGKSDCQRHLSIDRCIGGVQGPDESVKLQTTLQLGGQFF